MLGRLLAANPWWGSGDAILKDPHITEWDRTTLKWVPRVSEAFEHGRDLVYVLRGPRQIGKTTLVKLLVKRLLGSGVPPRNIMYYLFDLEETPSDLVGVLENYMDNTPRGEGERFHLFLDEITSVREWQKGIKLLWDQGRLAGCTIIATGSHAADLRHSSERLPGRRGMSDKPLDKVLMPMKFAEYVSCMDAGLYAKLCKLGVVGPGALSSLSRVTLDITSLSGELNVCLPKLGGHLHDYAVTGGIPRIVDKYAGARMVSEGEYALYNDVIFGELRHVGKRFKIFEQLLPNILKSVGWTFTWEGLKKRTDIGSTETVFDYVGALEEMFAFFVLHGYDYETRRAMFKKEKKIHAFDPFYLHVLRGDKGRFESSLRFLEDKANMGVVVEGIVASHLRGAALDRAAGSLYHWRHRGREVDFVYDDGAGVVVPIEVKFQDSIGARDFDGLYKFARLSGGRPGILVTSKDMGTRGGVVVAPASLFLLMA